MFPESWFAAGVATDESAEAFARYAANDPAKSLRHWKWLAFQDHLEENTPLPADRCRLLLELGEREPDVNLGKAMMSAIRHQRFCPPELKDASRERHQSR